MNRIAPAEEILTKSEPANSADKEALAAAPADADVVSQHAKASAWDDDEDLWDNVPI